VPNIMKIKYLRYFWAILAIGSISSLFGQQSGIYVSGKVVTERHKPVADAFVYIHDTTGQLIHFVQTDTSGSFSLMASHAGKHRVMVSALNRQTIDTVLEIKHGVHWYFVLKKRTEKLSPVTIKAQQWEEVFKGDTIKYNLDAIRDGTEKTLRDLLEKIPGIEVKGNNITVNGKKVDRLLINGKNLFDRQHKLALDNIESKAVKGIEFYDHYTDPFSIAPPGYADNGNALNIKLDKSFTQKVKGNVDMAAGVNNKYGLHAKTYLFGLSHMFYGIGDMNNAGKVAFGLNDYINLQLNAGKNTLQIPSFLLDKNLSFDKRDYFGSGHFLVQPSEFSEIRGYVLFNKALAQSQKDMHQTFFDPQVPDMEYFDTRKGHHAYYSAMIKWRKKYKNNLRTDLKWDFSRLSLYSNRSIIDARNEITEQLASVNQSWNLHSVMEYRYKKSHYFSVFMSVGNGYAKDTLAFDRGVWSQPQWMAGPTGQQTLNRFLNVSSGLSYKTQLGESVYFNSSFGWKYGHHLFEVFQPPMDSMRNISLNRVEKYVTVGFYWHWKQWYFRPKSTWRIVSLFSPAFQRFERLYWLPDLNINAQYPFFYMSLFYHRSIDIGKVEYFYPSPLFTNYQTALQYKISPGDVATIDLLSLNLTSNQWWWRGFRLSAGISSRIQNNALHKLYDYKDHFYNVVGMPGKHSVMVNQTLRLRQKISRLFLLFKYKYAVQQLTGTYLTLDGVQIHRMRSFNHHITISWTPKGKNINLTLHSEWENLHDKTPLKNFFMQRRMWESRLRWNKRKWSVEMGLQQLWLESGAMVSHPLIPSLNIQYKRNADMEIYLEAFDFGHLDTWTISRFQTTETCFQTAREWHQAGYILLGMRWGF